MTAPDHDVLRVALVGAGERGREHAEAITAVDGLRLVAVAEPRNGAAAGLGVPVTAGVEELLAGVTPDYLVLATPPAVRLEPVYQAAAAGVRAIVVEKPLAASAGEACAMAEACARAGTLLVPGHQLRYVPAFAALREAVVGGELGALEFVRASAFGVITDQGPHLVDIVQWLTGARVEWVLAQRGESGSQTGAFHTTYLSLEGDLRAVVETGPLHQQRPGGADPWLAQRVTVVGSEGVGEASAAGGGRILTGAGRRALPGGHGAYLAATGALHAGVRDTLRDGRPQRGSAADAVHGIAVIDAAAASAARGERAMPAAPAPNGHIEAAPPAPDVSVLLPLTDHRGLLPDCLEGWRTQRLGAERCQLVLASDGHDPQLEALARAFLRPGDALVVVPGAHELVLYDAAARSAHGDLLLLSEPHCVPEPRCLDELLRFMDGGDWDGACLRSTALNPTNALARAEARMYEEGFSNWSQDGHWCKVILRGFAVRRAAYLAAGGFRSDCGRFAEYVLGMRLHEQGARLGYAAGATVAHDYTEGFRELEPPVLDFGAGECAWRSRVGGDDDTYIGVPPEWAARRTLDRSAARALAIPAARNLAQGSVWRSPGARWANLRALARHGPVTVAGGGARVWAARAQVWAMQARCRTLTAVAPDAAYSAYVRAYYGIAGLARLRWLAAHPQALAPLAPRERHEVAEAPSDRLLGFHPPEEHLGTPFRWTEATAAFELPFPPGTGRVALDSAGARPLGELGLSAFVAGRRLAPGSVQVHPGGIEIALPEPAGDAAPAITLTCTPFPAPGDPRELGLPVVAIRALA